MSREGMIVAPWTPEQVAALNDFQALGHVHPFTCLDGATLLATVDGWWCPRGCGYSQDWAHAFMADRTSSIWRDPLASFRRPKTEEAP